MILKRFPNAVQYADRLVQLHLHHRLPPSGQSFTIEGLLEGFQTQQNKLRRIGGQRFLHSEKSFLQGYQPDLKDYPEALFFLLELELRFSKLFPEGAPTLRDIREQVASMIRRGKVDWIPYWETVKAATQNLTAHFEKGLDGALLKGLTKFSDSIADSLEFHPFFTLIPVISDRMISLEEFNRLSPYAIGVAQLSLVRSANADGAIYSPAQFLDHDLRHGRLISSRFAPERNRNYFQIINERISFFRKFELFLRRTADGDKRKAYHLIWFALSHETPAHPMNSEGFQRGLDMLKLNIEGMLSDRILNDADMGPLVTQAQKEIFTAEYFAARIEELREMAKRPIGKSFRIPAFSGPETRP